MPIQIPVEVIKEVAKETAKELPKKAAEETVKETTETMTDDIIGDNGKIDFPYQKTDPPEITEVSSSTSADIEDPKTQIERSDILETKNVEKNKVTPVVLKPNIEGIKTRSLESLKKSNVEKFAHNAKEAKETANDLRELTSKEKKEIKEKTHLPDFVLKQIRVDVEGVYHLKCRNEYLAGKLHETTGVKYVEKTIDINGIKIKVVVPEFSSAFDCVVDKELWGKGDIEIFKNCTEQLRDYLEKHPEEKSKFTEQQLKQIANGEPHITGYTWHHSEVPGKMQLVESKAHALTGHTGGNMIWCNGVR